MYDFLNGIDPYAEHDEQTIGVNIDALRTAGNDELADELEAEAIRLYGDTEATIAEDADELDEDLYW